MGRRKLLHACSTKVPDSKTTYEEVIGKAEEEENQSGIIRIQGLKRKIHACSTKVPDSKTMKVEVIGKVEEEENQSSITRIEGLKKKNKMERKLLNACSTALSNSKTTNEEVIRKAEEEDELAKESPPSKRFKGNDEDEMIELPGFSLAPSVETSKSGVIFVLEKASLTLASVGRKFQILRPSIHATFMRKKKMNPYNYRPDIIHQALCKIMDSRLRMVGRLKAVYIKTDEGVLIKVEPNALIPRTLGRFCSMMAELLQKLSIKAKGKGGKLLRLVENPVTQYLPVNSRKIGLSYSSKKAVDLEDYVNAINHDEDLVFVVGAMAHGKIESDYIDDLISVCDLPLSAAVCLQSICNEMERRWNIL